MRDINSTTILSFSEAKDDFNKDFHFDAIASLSKEMQSFEAFVNIPTFR